MQPIRSMPPAHMQEHFTTAAGKALGLTWRQERSHGERDPYDHQ
jgi:hypothetical protein